VFPLHFQSNTSSGRTLVEGEVGFSRMIGCNMKFHERQDFPLPLAGLARVVPKVTRSALKVQTRQRGQCNCKRFVGRSRLSHATCTARKPVVALSVCHGRSVIVSFWASLVSAGGDFRYGRQGVGGRVLKDCGSEVSSD
jgi:hypothetical protein